MLSLTHLHRPPSTLRVPGLPAGPLSRGLVAAWDFTTGSLTDLIRGLTLTRATDGNFGAVYGGQGLYANLGKAASVTCPSYLKLTLPISIVIRAAIGPNTENGGMIFGVTYDRAANDDDDPSYSFQTISAFRNVWLSWRNGTGQGDMAMGDIGANYALRPMSFAARFTSTERAAFGNGRLVNRVTDTYSDPAYTANSDIAIGDSQDTLMEYALIYNRALSNEEMSELTGPNPWGWKGYGSNPAFWQPDLSEVAPGVGQSFGPLVWVEWEGSDGTIRKWAPVDLPDPTSYYYGYKAPRLVSAGRVVRALSDEQGEYQGQTFEVTVTDAPQHDDPGRDIRTLLGASDNRRHLLNTRMVVRMISEEDWRAKRVPRTVAIGLLRGYRNH